MLTALLQSTLRVTTPLLFAAMGGLICERAGVTNIALEGLMLAGAFGAAAATHAMHNPWAGLVVGMASGTALAAVYGVFALRWRANQIVAATAINMLALGATPFLCKILYGQTGATPTIPTGERFHAAPAWGAWVVVVAAWFWLARTRSGLRVRFAGEHPGALGAAGVRVAVVRWWAVLASGALAGAGGASLSTFLASFFSREMTAGRGFIALAALVFGRWRPLPTAAACLLFGFTEALQIRLQGTAWGGGKTIPVQFVQILPYVATVVILAGWAGRSRAPKALGVPLEEG